MKWLLKTAIIFFAAFVVLAIVATVEVLLFEKKYESKIYPNIYLGNLNIGGMTYDDAEKVLEQKIGEVRQSGIPLQYEEKKIPLSTTFEAMDAGVAFEVINFDTKQTLEQAYDIGRNGDFTANLLAKVQLIMDKKNISLYHELNAEKIKEMVKEDYPELETPSVDATLKIKDGQAYIEDEKPGKEIEFDPLLAELDRKLAILEITPITLSVRTSFPKIQKSAFIENNSLEKIQEIINLAPIELTSGKQKWAIDKNTFQNWVSIKRDYAFCSTTSLKIFEDSKLEGYDNQAISSACGDGPDNIKVGLDKDAVAKYLEKNISPKVDVAPSNSRFEIKGGKVSEFQVGRSGQKMDLNKNFYMLEYAVTYKKGRQVKLAIDKMDSEVDSINELNDLGITEIIGTGQSSFAGSPNNRRHNIKIGGSSLHGVLIKPEEEFSLIKALGKIDGTTGYLPELVIKQNRTVPEYGGGLCQIGTTVFRTALASGLPITARTNHSYRVSYYEPAGTDATIYDPWPDFRFKNDTGNYILIQMRMSGNNISFDFWGKKDGRKAVQTKPVISNLVKPGPTKIIETTELKPGVKKCTETAHTGADAYFKYTVTYPNGEVKTKGFSSHYKPWRAVCLLGVEKKVETKTNDISTSTQPAVNP